MKIYNSDGKKLINAEYDDIIEVNDMLDGMKVLSVQSKSDGEYAVFLLETSTKVTCYIFDEVFIIGKGESFETLVEAIEAWSNDEI
jgi:hypothetical protein